MKAKQNEYEIVKSREQIRAAIALGDRMAARCTLEEFQDMRCPICSKALTIHTHTKSGGFSLRCSESSLHMDRSGTVAPPAPEWWAAYEGGLMVD